MAYTTPRTWVAGEIATAANLNTHVRDNMSWCLTDAPAASVYNNANLTHNSTGNWFTVTANSEYFDNASLHSTSSNTSRLTVPSGGGGKYLMGSSISMAANATGIRSIRILSGGVLLLTQVNQPGSSAVAFDVPIVTLAGLSAADYIETEAFQSSGGNLTITYSSAAHPNMWFTWIRS